jgi:hypothetical protein
LTRGMPLLRAGRIRDTGPGPGALEALLAGLVLLL